VEAPIEDFNLVGDWDKPASFDQAADRHLLTNPKSQAKIVHKWAKIIVPFNLNFVNSAGAENFMEEGEVNRDWLAKNLPDVLPQLKIRDDAVNIIFTNNTGAERVPMTAWIMAHRFGHALQRYGKNQYFRDFRDHIGRGIETILQRGYRVGKPDSYLSANPKVKKFEAAQIALLTAIGTFKSARDNAIRDDTEFCFELLAQYMLTGTIKFNPIPSVLDCRGARSTKQLQIDPQSMDAANESLAHLAHGAAALCGKILHSAVGRIYVM